MPTHTFVLNGKKVSVDVEDNVRLLWVIRDLLGFAGPKYGGGPNACTACTSHINGKACHPRPAQVTATKSTDKRTTTQGNAAPAGNPPNPLQEPGPADGDGR